MVIKNKGKYDPGLHHVIDSYEKIFNYHPHF